MILMGYDLETTGLEPETDRIIEAAVILMDWDTKRVVRAWSSLLENKGGDNTIPADTTKIHKIDERLIQTSACWDTFLVPTLEAYGEIADYVVAHKHGFEKAFTEPIWSAAREGKPLPWSWLDTMTDIDYPETVTTRKLTYLCAEHGILVRNAHAALADVDMMMQLLEKYDIEQVIEWSLSPSVQLRAVVSYDDRQKAKDHGFHWDKTLGERGWWIMDAKEIMVDRVLAGADFEVVRVGSQGDR